MKIIYHRKYSILHHAHVTNASTLEECYLEYLNLCTRVVRRSVKAEHIPAAVKREESAIKFSKWENGQKGKIANRKKVWTQNKALKIIHGTLKGHDGWVTSIAVPSDTSADFIVTSSRDKTALVWQITHNQTEFAIPKKSLKGHNHFVQDVVLSSDGCHALTASWDNTMRLWDLNTGETTQRFVGHTGDVMSVSFSPDNRQIVSGSRDKTIKIWNSMGECKATFDDNASRHSEWVSCVRFSPNTDANLIVSSGWDKAIKVWDASEKTLKTTHSGHTGYLNTVTVSPDGSLCASGGKDSVLMLWDLNEGKHLYSLDAGDIIHSLVFSPIKYWLCAATDSCIKIWDLASKKVVAELRPDFVPSAKGNIPACISLAWSADGQYLYSGYTDNQLRVWQVSQSAFN